MLMALAETYTEHVQCEVETPPEHFSAAALTVFALVTPAEEKGLRLHFGFAENPALQDVTLGSWRSGMRRIRCALRSRL